MSQDAGFVVSGRNYGLVPMQGQATDAETQLARLEDFMNAGYDAEAAKRAREYYGEGVPIEHISEEDMSFFAGAAFARIKGVPNNPEAYWHAQKKDIPDVEREQMFELLGAELRQQVRGKWDERQARIKAVEESLGRMDVYVRGDELGEVFSEQDLANVRGVTDAETMADAEAVRSWMRTYMLPLAGKDDAEEVLRTLDGLEDEFFEVIGTSPRRAELAYNAMMHWAEGMKQSGKVGVTDEFIVGVGKKLSNWGKAAHLMAPAVVMAPVGNPDFPVMLSDEAMAGQQAELASRHEEYARHENARSILRAAINKSLELGDDVSWWKGAARTASQMAGDSSAYLLPGVGMYTGTADLLVGGATETVDRFALQGVSGDAAAGQAAIETGVQALVELMPWGRVGGKGLSSFTRRYFGDAVEKGTAGKFSRWVVRNTQKSTARALLAEGAASFVDEGILEPIAGGLLTYGAEQAADVLGIAHAQSREFTECFDELKALYTDPYQAAGLLLFTAGLTGAGAYGVHQNVKYFAKHRKMWEAAGLTPEQVDRVMAADDRVELGGKLVREGWETDPAGMRERVLKVNKDFAERGEVLVLTGEGALDAELENSELAPAYRAVWQEYQEKGLLPKVEAVGDNQFRITKEGVDITLDARGADAYLQHAIDEVDRMQTRELQQRLGEVHFVDLRAELADAVSTIAGGAAMRAAGVASERTGIAVADITKGLPEWLADGIVKRGQITLKDAQDITEWAIGRIDGLVQEGMSPADARLTRASADGMARTLGDWSTFARDFAHREQLAGLNLGEGAISISRMRNEQAVAFDGRQVLGQTIMTLPGNVRHQGAVEDVTESFADMMVQQRAAAIREAKPESTPAEAEKAAWQELGELVQRARAAVLKADSAAEIEEVKPGDKMSIIEALSTMATSKFVASGAVPGWMQSLTAALKGNLAAADSLAKVRAAYSSVLQHDPASVSELDTMLNKLGVYVQDTFREARIEAVDIQAWKHARALVTARAESPAGSGGAPVSEVVQQAGENYEVRVTSYEFESSAATPQEVAREAQEILDGMVPGSNAPAEMQGVFVDDKCYYNAAGGFWCGMIDKHKLRDGTEQVKVGAKGKHGVIAGRELTGRFQQNVGAIYVWRRTSGELQVISGRHRFAKLMEDDSAQSCNAYVFVEDAAHDERWARMLDYENNMRDDQADEVTAATYVRETGLSDAELEVRGLMRNGTRCKRGALIGRFAREELWTRFINGAVKPMDAEIICNLTRSIREQGRVEEIQRRCCMLLDEKKSWEYIGAMVQLMANKENVVMKQGLLDFGADFEADLARAAEWIERNIKAINESVMLLKQGRKLSGKKRAEAERLGISTATQEGTEQMLYDLEMLRGQFEMIGSYPDLVAQAQMWDGETEVDPVGQYLERARVEREQARTEGEMDAEEYLESHLDDATGEFSFSIFNERRWANDVWPTRAMKKIEADWLERLDAYIAEYQAAKANPNMKRPMGLEIYVCPTPGVLSLVGVTSRDVVTTRHALDHDMFTKHGMTRKALRHLPSAIANPICIAESQSVPGALEILTTLTETVEDSKTKALVKKNVLVALHVGVTSSTDRKLIVSKIASAYGKNHIRTIINKHKILYWNDQKGKVMLNDYRLQLPQAVAHDLSTGNIWDFNDLVKYKQQNKFSFSMERNLAAVHSIPVDTMLDVEKKLGGLPKPSIAITRLDKPYSWGYSERVYLIGKPELADPQKGNLVYDRDAWTGKGPFLLEDGGAYDYRKGEYFEPTLEEFVARTIKKKGQEDGSSFRGQSAVAIGTMDAVKAHREKLSDTYTSNAQKAETDEALEELIENVVKLSKKGLNEDAVAIVLARVCWRSSPMNHGAPSEMKTSRDTVKRILNELGMRVKDIKKPLVDSFMKAVAGLQNELEDYLESVPQRAVMFNEWEYAVMPESMKGTPGLDKMLERNGIKPVWHDGTEEGRRTALAGLVNDAKVSFSMEKASLRALDLLSGRADERAGEQLIKDWQAACENWGRFSREDAGRLGNGAKMLGEMQALIGATKGVLPERYCRMGHLNGLMRWASIYAKMQQDGTLPQVGEIKGPIYQKFLEKLQQADELNRLQGMSEQEAQEAMALLAGERLDTAMMKVARECRRRLELFLKDRELERIDHIVEKAYPKRQNGQKWPRGKMAADAYRRMERARQYMNLPADEVAERINDAKRKLDALDATDADFERKEEELEEEISLLQTFGCWENMGFEQARRACGVMTEMVLLGRARWKEKLQAERRRANYDRARISRNFRTKLADVQRKRAKTDAKEKARKRTIGKNLAMGFMSYSQLMLALEPKLGKEFTGRHMRMIAKAHERLQLGTQQLHRRMFSTLSEITGLKTEGEMEEWLKSNNEIIDTGIVLKPRFTETCRMTPEEVEEWLALSETQREARRKQADEEAAAKGEQPDNVPSEDVLERMREKLEASRKAGTTPKEYVVTVEKRYESPLHCTKEAMLFAILTFEQEDYTRLMDVNGVNEKALQRMRELVGDKLLRWGYAMREMLNEQGLTMAAVYEAHTGVPFAKRANYFRGVFDIAKAKDKGESIDSATSITGGKYGCLIPRQYHHQMLNWGTSATQVFIGTYKEQQNYICTSHITREWRTLLSNQGFEKRLRAEIGDAALDTIHGWCKLIDGSVIADAKVNAMMNRLLGKVMGAYAVSRLAGNVYTIIKQVSAVLNGFVGGYVPEQVLVGDAVAQQLTYRHIGFGEYAAALARAMSGQTEISAEEIANAGFIAGRKRVKGAHLEEAAMLAPGQSVPGKVGRAGRAVYEANMDAIGYVDRKCNTLAALAVADAVYRAAKRENKEDGLVPDAELRRIAIETAGMAIDRAAQPHLRTQKGYWAAGGGAFGAMGNFFYMFKSEVLGKLGLYVGQMFAGHHGAWIGGALSFGVLNSLVLALIDYVRGYWYDDEEDKWEKRAKQFAWNVFANDISAVPVLGDLEGWGRSTMLGGRPWNSSLVDMVVPFKDMYTYGKREVKYIAEEESWDKHVQALCGFARALGAAGGWWQGNSRVAVGSCAELALAVAAISNIVRFGKDAVKKVVGED